MQMYIRYFQQFKSSLRLGRRNLISVTAVSFPDRYRSVVCWRTADADTHTQSSLVLYQWHNHTAASRVPNSLSWTLCQNMLYAEFSLNQVVVCVCMHINVCVFSLVGRAFVVECFVAGVGQCAVNKGG